jgi:Fic family protein
LDSKVDHLTLGLPVGNPRINVPEYVTAKWIGDLGAYGSKRSRATFTYRAYIPDLLAGLKLSIPGDVSLLISDAEGEIRALDSTPGTRGLEAVAPLLLRAESVASSRIEGLELSQRNLARALFDPQAARGTARAVAGNVQAMEAAIWIGDKNEPLTVADIVSIHRTLLQGTQDDAIAGKIREVQNWIGGRLNSPIDAEFIPPPPDRVELLLEDLVAFLNREDLPAIVQAAIAHAQFETIHPFVDGNGRVGRCLIHVVLRRRGLAQHVVPPVSIVLATNAKAYVKGLTDFRAGNSVEWCRSFAYACRLAAVESARLADRLTDLVQSWQVRAGSPRRGSSAEKIIKVLPGHPIIDVATANHLVGGSDEAARLALNALEQAGVLRQITAGRYRRAWAAEDLFDLLNEYEHSLATPTRSDQPRRRSPVLKG